MTAHAKSDNKLGVVAIGELVVDWIATSKSGSWSKPDQFLRSPGGNAANVATALARLGAPSRLVAKVGSDIHGRYLLETLCESGIDTRFVFETSRFPTAQCYVLTGDDEENIFFNWPKPNACHQLTTEDLVDDMFEGSFALHVTGISLTVEPRSHFVIEAMRKARERGLLVSFDAGFPYGEGELARTLIAEALSLAHLVKVNLPELIYWSKPEANVSVNDLFADPSRASHLDVIKQCARNLKEKYCAEVVLCTLGRTGSIVVDDSEEFYPAIPVQSVAGVGAGDAYVAAVLFSLASRLTEIQSLKNGDGKRVEPAELLSLDWRLAAPFANAVGALATRTVSASAGLPTLSEVQELLSSLGVRH